MTARSDIARQLGMKVAQLRRDLKLGQKHLSEKAGTSDKTISQLERGVSVPRIEKLVKIAEVLHATLPELFGSTEEARDERRDKRRKERRKVLDRIDYILRGRSTIELNDVLAILDLVFKIKRRERPDPPPAKRPRSAVSETGRIAREGRLRRPRRGDR